jgi:hypothetical protein
MTYKCGQTPGTGRYVCQKRGEDILLDENTDTPPPCAACHGRMFIKG